MAEGTSAAAADSPSERPSLWNGGETHTIEKKAMRVYINSLDNLWPEDFPVYFTDGVADLPWLDVQDFANFMGVFLSAKDSNGEIEKSDIAVTVDEAQKTVTWMRRESDLVLFSFADQQIIWSDYEGFSRSKGRPYMDMMLPLTTAWGTSYVTSGPIRLSFLKNGSYYDADRGVEPDYVISSYEHYYDREALVEYINSLY